MFLYSLDSIVAFSTVPLSIASVMGILFCFVAFLIIIFIIVRTIMFGDPTSGWPSMVCIMFFIGGVQLLCVGIMGQYLSKAYLEVKRRPIYIISEQKKQEVVDVVYENKIMVNFELMRIISMLMIVLWHIIIHGGFDNVVDNYGRLFDIILAIIIVHVNSFVILMGFFQYKKKFKFNKILNLLGVSWFYRIFFVLIFAFCFHYIYAADILALNIMPIDMNDNYWFIMKYVLLYALCPFLNILINNIGKKQHFVLLILLFIVFSVLPLFSGDSIILNDGHSLIQMITLYFIGAYLGKYSIFDHCFIKKMSSKKRTVISIFIFILCAFLNLALYKLGIIMQRFDGHFYI